MDKLVCGGIGAVLGALATSAVFLALPDNTATAQNGEFVAMQPLPEAEQVKEDRFLDLNLGAEDDVPAAMQPLSEAEQAEEDRFLDLKLGTGDAPAIEPLKDAQNVPYYTCEKSPELVAYLGKKGNAISARRADMNFFLVATNVLATRDCTCTGKMIPASTLMAFETRMMEAAGVTNLEELVTRPYRDEARTMRWQIEELCGGPF